MSGRCMSGGRHRKGHKGKKTRKMRGGVFVGMGEPINPGSFVRVPVSGSGPVDSATGGEMKDIYAGGESASVLQGGKRRTRKGKGKSKKGGKKSKKSMRRSRGRKMRGGVYGVSGGVVNAGAVGYGYKGPQGGVTGGIAPAAGYSAKGAVDGGPTAGADGVYSA